MKMAKHKFDGEWSYFEVDDDNFPPNPIKKDGKMKFNIPDDQTGKIEAGSVHGNGVLTGNASKDAKKITFNEVDNVKGRNRDYEGELLIEVGDVMVIVGRFNKHMVRGKRTEGQEDGTWVITKP
jgi:hypothetical protein